MDHHTMKLPTSRSDFSNEILRAISLSADKLLLASPMRLANAGFCFNPIQPNKGIHCYLCGVVKSDQWQESDRPWEVHAQLNPQCQLVIERARQIESLQATSQPAATSKPSQPLTTPVQPTQSSSGPAPAPQQSQLQTDSAPPATQPPSSMSSDELQTDAEGYRPTPTQSRPVTTLSTINIPAPTPPPSSRNVDSTPRMYPTSRFKSDPVYPIFSTLQSRKKTFTKWTATECPPLADFFLNGMYFAGYADCVRCFFCGVGLKSWVRTDNVWDEHVRWRPNCEYLLQCKGEEFIRQTQARLNPRAAISAQQSSQSSAQPTEQPAQQPTEQQPTSGATPAETPRSTQDIATDGEFNNDRVQQLQQENARLQEMRTCKVCHKNPVGVIFLPCGHIVACTTCAPNVRKCPGPSNNNCQYTIRATANVYFS